MGFFSALTGKIAHFNSLFKPIHNRISTQIDELEESVEKILLAAAFEITNIIIIYSFNPDSGIFRKKLGTMTQDDFEKVYYTILDANVSQLLKAPLVKVNQEKMIHCLADISQSTVTSKKMDIQKYQGDESCAHGVYKNICDILNLQLDVPNASLFGQFFIKKHIEFVEELGNAMFGHTQ